MNSPREKSRSLTGGILWAALVVAGGGYYLYQSAYAAGVTSGYSKALDQRAAVRSEEEESCRNAVSAFEAQTNENARLSDELAKLKGSITVLGGLTEAKAVCDAFAEQCEEEVAARIEDALSDMACTEIRDAPD